MVTSNVSKVWSKGLQSMRVGPKGQRGQGFSRCPSHSLKLCSAENPGHKEEEPLAPGLQSVLVSEVLG